MRKIWSIPQSMFESAQNTVGNKWICREFCEPTNHSNPGRSSRRYSFEEFIRYEAGPAFCTVDANECVQGEIAKDDTGMLILTGMVSSCEETIQAARHCWNMPRSSTSFCP